MKKYLSLGLMSLVVALLIVSDTLSSLVPLSHSVLNMAISMLVLCIPVALGIVSLVKERGYKRFLGLAGLIIGLFPFLLLLSMVLGYAYH